MATWRATNPEKHLASLKRRDKKKLSAAHKRWRQKNIERERQRVAAWSKENPDKAAANAAARRASVRRATPAWANDFFIKEAYHLAMVRTRVTGIRWVVDHIVPLKGKTVCGLHVETNLRVITEHENAVKSNRHEQ